MSNDNPYVGPGQGVEDSDAFDEDDFVPHHHSAASFSTGSRFSRADMPAHAAPVPQQPLDQPMFPEVDQAPRVTQPVAQPVPQPAPQPMPQPTARQAPQPAPQQIPQTMPNQRRQSDPEANRALFDAQYGAPDAYGQQGQEHHRPPRRHRHKAGNYNAPQDNYAQQAAASPERRMRRGRGGRRHPVRNAILFFCALIVGLYLVVCLPIDMRIAFPAEEGSKVSSELSFHIPATPQYILALGSDAREGDTVSRTDTMILIRADFLTNTYTMISIPRDTMVEIPGHGKQKINAAYAFGGAAGSVAAVSQLMNVDVSQVAVIHFDGVKTLVDAIGGITVQVPVNVNDPSYTGLVMPAGTYEMDGETALLFSRVRHGFELGDYQRQADQRIVIEAIMSKVSTLPPTQLPAVANAMGDLLDTSLRMYNLIPLLIRYKLTPATIYSASLPSYTDTVDGVSYVIADEQALATMMSVVNAGKDPNTVATGLR